MDTSNNNNNYNYYYDPNENKSKEKQKTHTRYSGVGWVVRKELPATDCTYRGQPFKPPATGGNGNYYIL